MTSRALLTIARAFLLFPALSVAAQDDNFDVEQTYQAT
jgi:hypothetical protein